MKKITLILIALLPLMSRAQSGKAVINLDIDTVTASKAYLVYAIGENSKVDSASIKNGKVSFSVNVPHPVVGRLSLDDKGYGLPHGKQPDLLLFYIEKGVINIKTHNEVKNADITGSKLNNDLLRYNKFVSEPIKLLDDASYEYSMTGKDKYNDTAYQRAFSVNMRKWMGELQTLQIKWIKANPGAYCSLMALGQVAGSQMNVAVVEPLYNDLTPALRNTAEGKDIAERIAVAKKITIGAMAPLFEQEDTSGHLLKLADFRGKYVLLDFWASWCGPCRAENPNYVKVYNEYKDKNFTMLGVSLDRAGMKKAWLDAIKKDGLTWPQVSDLNYWNNKVARMYDVRAVPSNFLIDPTGKIIANNLQGEALRKKLEELLK